THHLCPFYLLSLSFFLLPPPPTSTLFPYTTLFRSRPVRPCLHLSRTPPARSRTPPSHRRHPSYLPSTTPTNSWESRLCYELCQRSEEHTSELQSQSNLVCRLLLEKKKKKTKKTRTQRQRDHDHSQIARGEC